MSRYTSKHTGKKIDDTIDNVVNPNLLDNWYFGNPVNQRDGYVVPAGKPYYFEYPTISGYTTTPVKAVSTGSYYNIVIGGVTYAVNASDVVRGYTGAGYGLDRWRYNGTILNTDSGVNLTSNSDYISQTFEDGKLKALHGNMLTLSVLTSDNQLITGTLPFDAYSGNQEYFAISRLIHLVLTADRSIMVWCAVPCTLVAGKLELGSTQTLAHQDEDGNWVLNEIPNYAEELAKCQRYQLKLIYGTSQNYAPIGFGFANNTTSIRILIPTPATMRASPTLSYLSGSISGLTILCDGKQLIPESVNTVDVLPYGVALMFKVSDATSSAPCVLRATSAYCILDANL